MSKKSVRKDEEFEHKIPKKIPEPTITKEIEEILEPKPDITENTANISYDGKQWLVRFPTEIANAIEIGKNDELKFRVEKHSPKLGGKTDIVITYIRGDK